jgi:hypothetical protein
VQKVRFYSQVFASCNPIFADLMPCKNVLIHLKIYLIDEEFFHICQKKRYFKFCT